MNYLIKFGMVAAIAFGFIFITADSANAQRRGAGREYREDVRDARRDYNRRVRNGDYRKARREYREDIRDARREYRNDTRNRRVNRNYYRQNNSRYYYYNGRMYRRW